MYCHICLFYIAACVCALLFYAVVSNVATLCCFRMFCKQHSVMHNCDLHVASFFPFSFMLPWVMLCYLAVFGYSANHTVLYWSICCISWVRYKGKVLWKCRGVLRDTTLFPNHSVPDYWIFCFYSIKKLWEKKTKSISVTNKDFYITFKELSTNRLSKNARRFPRRQHEPPYFASQFKSVGKKKHCHNR